MKLNVDDLRRHYASLSDEALRAIKRTELVEIAQQCYDHELAQRDPLKIRATPVHQAELEEEAEDAVEFDRGIAPDWIAEAACVCVFPNAASDALNARVALENNGVPCYVEFRETEPDITPPTRSEYCVMVPGGLNLRATSVLDKEIFNEQVESGWRTHLQALSDEELLGKKEILLEGILDRVARLARAYDEEVARRTKTTHQ
jgi:hypothetical protein